MFASLKPILNRAVGVVSAVKARISGSGVTMEDLKKGLKFRRPSPETIKTARTYKNKIMDILKENYQNAKVYIEKLELKRKAGELFESAKSKFQQIDFRSKVEKVVSSIKPKFEKIKLSLESAKSKFGQFTDRIKVRYQKVISRIEWKSKLGELLKIIQFKSQFRIAKDNLRNFLARFRNKEKVVLKIPIRVKIEKFIKLKYKDLKDNLKSKIEKAFQSPKDLCSDSLKALKDIFNALKNEFYFKKEIAKRSEREIAKGFTSRLRKCGILAPNSTLIDFMVIQHETIEEIFKELKSAIDQIPSNKAPEKLDKEKVKSTIQEMYEKIVIYFSKNETVLSSLESYLNSQFEEAYQPPNSERLSRLLLDPKVKQAFEKLKIQVDITNENNCVNVLVREMEGISKGYQILGKTFKTVLAGLGIDRTIPVKWASSESKKRLVLNKAISSDLNSQVWYNSKPEPKHSIYKIGLTTAATFVPFVTIPAAAYAIFQVVDNIIARKVRNR